MKKNMFLLILTVVLFSSSLFAQCEDDKAGKLGQYWSKEIANLCAKSANKLKITVTKCLYEKTLKDGTGGWKIWTSVEWQGKYTTLDYAIKIYIEDVEPSGKQPGSVQIYFLDYSNTLTYTCIDLKKTRSLSLVAGTVQYYPFLEFEHRDPAKNPDTGQ